MMHYIQRAGHAFLPVLLFLVGLLTALAFYLDNFYGSPPPPLVVLALIALALSTEWLTATFNQDMQDAITRRAARTFPILRAALASAVSGFIFASATDGIFMPKHVGGSSLAWSIILAVGVFGSQFMLKLIPEKKHSANLVAVAITVEEWLPEASAPEKAAAAARVFQALTGQALVIESEEPMGQQTGKYKAMTGARLTKIQPPQFPAPIGNGNGNGNGHTAP